MGASRIRKKNCVFTNLRIRVDNALNAVSIFTVKLEMSAGHNLKYFYTLPLLKSPSVSEQSRARFRDCLKPYVRSPNSNMPDLPRL